MIQTASVDKALLYSVWAGLFLLLLMPLVITTSTIFPYIVGKAIYARVTIEITFGLWLVLAFRAPSCRPPRSWLILIFAVYLGISLLTGIFGVSLQRSLWSTYERMQGVVDLAHWFALTVVLASVLRSLLAWRYLLNFNLGVSLLMALMGLGQRYYDGAIPFYEFLQSDGRLDITLGNPAFVGAYMLVNVLVGLGFLVDSFQSNPRPTVSPSVRRRRSRRREREQGGDFSQILLRAFWTMAIVLGVWVLMLSGTRGAFIGLFLGLLLFGVSYLVLARTGVLKLITIGVVGIIVVITLVFISARSTPVFEKVADSSLMVARIGTIGLKDLSVRSRLASLSAGLQGFTARPILGWGPENYVIPFGRYFNVESKQIAKIIENHDQAHNKPMEELATKGVLGFASYVGLWAFMFWIIIRRARRRDAANQVLILFIGAALVGYLVQNFFLFDTPATLLQLILLMGFVAYLEVTLRESATEPATRPLRDMRLEQDYEKEKLKRPTWMGQIYALIGSSWGRLLFLQRVRNWVSVRGYKLTMIGLIAVLAFLILSVYVNYRTYNAAVSILRVSNQSNTFEQTLGNFKESIDTFSPLANYPRLILFRGISENWESLSDAQAEEALITLDRESKLAIESEPENWRIYVELARLYKKASTFDPKYLERADSYLDTASELAPNRIEVLELLPKQ